MTITKSNLFSVLLLGLAVAGCHGGSDDKSGATSGAKAVDDQGATAPAPAKFVTKPLGSLGLQASVPEDATIDDNSKTAGFPSITIASTPMTFVSGAGEDSLSAQTFDAAKQEVQKDPNPFKRFTKSEVTADGWKLEYELESMMDKTPVYGFKVHFKVDGKPFECGSNGGSTAERDTVIKICTSIQKAKS
jgi:hypothetical protein